MITANNNKVKMEGKGDDLLTEYACITASLIDIGMPVELLLAAVKAGDDAAREKKTKAVDNKEYSSFVDALNKKVQGLRNEQKN